MSSLPHGPGGARHTYRDYAAWPEGQRWELVRGQAWAMSPAPTWNHQEIAGFIYSQLRQFLNGKPCRAFIAPVDVFLPAPGQTPEDLDGVDTVVQPDVGVVCDKSKILPDKGVFGAPDLVVEVLSPSSVLHDLNTKLALYESAGVREYWVVDGHAEYLMVFGRGVDGRYGEPRRTEYKGLALSAILEGFSIDLGGLRSSLD
jgi:Uma2 family endonuclease